MKRRQDGELAIRFAEADVLCGVCLCLMHDPATVGCECRRAFCAACLAKIKDRCPVCNGAAREMTLCCRQFCETLDKIKRKCPEEKCRKKGTWSEIQKHVTDECPYRLVTCPNSECGQRINGVRALAEHMRTCDLHRCKNFLCKRNDQVFGCPTMGTKSEVEKHEVKCAYAPEALAQIKELLEKSQHEKKRCKKM